MSSVLFSNWLREIKFDLIGLRLVRFSDSGLFFLRMWEESLVENMTIFIKKRNKNCICQRNERLTKNKPRDIKKM